MGGYTVKARGEMASLLSGSAVFELDGEPVRAMSASQPNFSVGPVTVSSSAAHSSGLPRRAFASLKARGSIGPEGGTPTSQ